MSFSKNSEKPLWVERRVILSTHAPRVKIWTPISINAACYEMVSQDSSVQRIYLPGQNTFFVPDKSVFGVSDVYAGDEILGFSGDKFPRFVGGDRGQFIILKGTLLRDVNINGRNLSAEMRFSLMQTQLNPEQLRTQLQLAKQELYRYRHVIRRKFMSVS